MLLRTISLFLVLSDLSFTHSSITGPGVSPHKIVLPCRYVWIQQSNSSLPKLSVTGELATTGQDVPLRSEVFATEDGQYLGRYQNRISLKNLKLSLNDDEEVIEISERVHPHGCDCPQHDFDSWLEEFGCPASDSQIEADFAPYDTIDMEQGLHDAVDRFARHAGSHSFCHYSLLDGKMFRRCYGEHVGFKMFPDSTFSLLARMVNLPNLEFLINLGDWPLVDKDESPAIPMLSWCKTDQKADILLPTYELTEATTECMGRQMMDMLSVQGNANIPWEEREEKAFFKGRDSSRMRLKLARMIKDSPAFLAGGITRYFFFRDEEADIGTVPHSSFFDFFKYKYVISMDGTVAAYRFPFLMAGGSLILKQESSYYEHFYGKLKPWVHYVPIQKDLNDLFEKIEWALKHDDEAKKIASNARNFARKHLMPREVICYHALVLKEWSRRQTSPTKVREGMEEVPNGHQEFFKCDCRKDSKRDEL